MIKKRKRISKVETRSTPHDGEVRRDAEEVVAAEGRWRVVGPGRPPTRAPRNYRYVDELVRLQFELLKMQEWVRLQGLKVCVLFEGRDAAGKGGVIKRITESLNPRVCRVVSSGLRPCGVVWAFSLRFDPCGH